MDVSGKQLFSYQRRLLSFGLSVASLPSHHLNRSNNFNCAFRLFLQTNRAIERGAFRRRLF